MTRHRRVETGTWVDQRFTALSKPPPNAQTLWLYLLFGQRTTIFPGIVVARPAVMASDLDWPLHPELGFGPSNGCRSLSDAWAEIDAAGMAEADWKAGVIVLPKALMHRDGTPRATAHPGSQNTFRGWARSWPDIPQCELTRNYLVILRLFAQGLDRISRGINAELNGNSRKSRGRPRAPKPPGVTYLETFEKAFETSLRLVADESPTGHPTGRRLARVPVPVPVSGVSESLGLRSSPELGLGSDSGSPPVSAPDPRPPERSSAGPQPQARRGYPTRGEVAKDSGLGMGVAASGGALGPAPYARADGSAVPGAPSAVPVPPPVLPPGAVVPSAEELARRELVKRLWAKLNAIRAEMALEFAWSDVRELHPMDPGVGELNARLRELGASGEELAEHVLACAAAEAKSLVPPSVRWLTGAVFGMPQWRRYTGMRLADAAAPPGHRSAKHGPPPERAAADAALARERQAAADRVAREKRAADEESKADRPLTDDDRAAIRALAARVTKNPVAAAEAERSRAEAAFLDGDEVPDGELTEEESE